MVPVRNEQEIKAKEESQAMDTALKPVSEAFPKSSWAGNMASNMVVTAPATLVGGQALLTGGKALLSGARPAINALGNLIKGGAQQGATVGTITGASDIVNEGEDKLSHVLESTKKGAAFGAAAAPITALIPGVASKLGGPLSSVGNTVRASGERLQKQAGLAGGVTAALGGGDPISGIGLAIGTYAAGAGAKGLGSWMASIGARIQNMPAKYSTYLGQRKILGDKALGSSIFVFNQKDPEFRQAWKATESQE
jgi:hypothetical protein